MNYHTLITAVANCLPLWDRSHDKFRDQDYKAIIWNQIGQQLNSNGPVCKETFKALREKYIREREKLTHFGDRYKKWELLDSLQFLDPHIITRKPPYMSSPRTNEMIHVKQDPSEPEHEELDDLANSESSVHFPPEGYTSASNFAKELIRLVRTSRAIWDRHNKDYHDKTVKDQFWSSISRTLNVDVNVCMLRWKALREKYIRQKQKLTDGEAKWELLSDLSFLDNVIQYRKKHWQIEESSNMFAISDNSFLYSQANSDCEIIDDKTNDSIPNQPSSSTNNYHRTYDYSVFPDRRHALSNPKTSMADSTHDNACQLGRKRTASTESQLCFKKDKPDGQDRTPEQIFGEFVAAMLASKPEKDRNLAMMEIMTVLARPNMTNL